MKDIHQENAKQNAKVMIFEIKNAVFNELACGKNELCILHLFKNRDKALGQKLPQHLNDWPCRSLRGAPLLQRAGTCPLLPAGTPVRLPEAAQLRLFR